MSAYSAAETQNLCSVFWALPCLKIPYFNIDGQPLAAGVGWPQFYRVRALREPVPKPKKFAKYLQVPDSGVCAYFPKSLDWRSIVSDYKKSIIITEGELKAAKACKSGFATIGLGGVDSWRTKTFGHAMLPELRAIDWIKRDAIICFDSDMMSNVNIIKAIRGLSEMLKSLGALPRLLILPEASQGKTGLDDFLVAHGANQFDKFLNHHAHHISLASTLWDMNEDYCYIQSTGEVCYKPNGETAKPEKFKLDLTEDHYENVVKDNGEIFMEKQSAADAWLKWRMRSIVDRVVFEPGKEPRSVIELKDRYVYNSWPGWACSPKRGDITLFSKLFDNLFGDSLAERKWFLQWLAYPIQYPGTKLFTTPLIWSKSEGTGKSYLAVLIGELIYGDCYTIVAQNEFLRSFHEWAVGKQFVLVDDVAGGDKKTETDKIKPMITRPKIWVNIKNKSAYEARDCINYFWTSNYQDAFFLSDNDRRFFIFESKAKALPDSFFQELRAWSLTPDAGPALLDFLLHVDTSDFNPASRAPETQAKAEMRSAGLADVAQWAKDLLEDPSGHLVVGDAILTADVLTLRQIRACYDFGTGLRSENLTNKRLAAELRTAGAVHVNRDKPIRLPGQAAVDKYYAVRNVDKWLNASLDELQRHIMENAPKSARGY
jgi:hypothetical protein